MCAPLSYRTGGWQAHPHLLAMRVLPLVTGLLCLCVYRCRSLPPAGLCSGKGAPCEFLHAPRDVGPSAAAPRTVSPALCLGRGGCRGRPRRGCDGSGVTPGSIPCRGMTAALRAFPLPRLTPQS